MKLADLERHLKSQGCHFERQGWESYTLEKSRHWKSESGATPSGDQGSDREVHLPPVGHCRANKVAIIAPRDEHGV